MALNPEIDSVWVVDNVIGEGVGIVPKGVTVRVIAVTSEPTPGIGGEGEHVLFTTEPPAALRAISFPVDEFENHFVAATADKVEEKD